MPTLDMESLTFQLPNFRMMMEKETALKAVIKAGDSEIRAIEEAVALFDKVEDFIEKEVPAEQKSWIRQYSGPLLEDRIVSIKPGIEALLSECLKVVEVGSGKDCLSKKIQLAKKFVEMCFRQQMFDRLVEPVVTRMSEFYVIKSVKKCDPADHMESG